MENKKQLTINQLFWYFVIFSVLGLIIETLYGYATMGVWQSRKGLIWGPFCPVYGVGAVILILLLNHIDRKSYAKLFIYGFLIGSVVEYLLSYLLEAIYGIRFWDYAYTGKDVNGRICITYSMFWGILAIGLMSIAKPFIDKLIDKVPERPKKITEIILFIFLVIDALVTVWAINTYENRAMKQYYHEPIKTVEVNNPVLSIKNKIENEYFTNERMQKIFPNLRTKDKEGNEVWIIDIVKPKNESNTN